MEDIVRQHRSLVRATALTMMCFELARQSLAWVKRIFSTWYGMWKWQAVVFAAHGAHWEHANHYLACPIFVEVAYDAVALSRLPQTTLRIASSCHSGAGTTAQARQTVDSCL